MTYEDYISTLGYTECSVSLDGKRLEEVVPGFRVSNVSGREPLEFDVAETKITRRNGSIYEYKTMKTRTITISYDITTSTRSRYNEAVDLLKSFSNGGNRMIEFDDQINSYYTGTIQKISATEASKMVASGCYHGSGAIEILCTDPYRYSKVLKTATNNGGSTITLTNDGTEDALINVKATMKSDNGYVSFVLNDRFYQIGDPEEVDKEQKERSEELFDDHFTSSNGWTVNNGVTPPVTNERLQNGTITYVTEDAGTNEGYVKVSDYKTGNSWHGASLTKAVPQDSQGQYPVNWGAKWRFDFNTDGTPEAQKGSEIGHNSITFADTNDNIICAVVVEDNNAVAERSDLAIYIDGERVWDTRNTTKFYVTGRPDQGKTVSVTKVGDKITVTYPYADIKKTFTTTNTNAELRKVTWYCAAYKTYSAMHNNLIRAFTLTKHNVEYYQDIPNFLSSGDVVSLDSENNELYINDGKDWDRVDIGSQPLLLPPGMYTLGVAVSEWASMPDVEVTYQERWK